MYTLEMLQKFSDRVFPSERGPFRAAIQTIIFKGSDEFPAAKTNPAFDGREVCDRHSVEQALCTAKLHYLLYRLEREAPRLCVEMLHPRNPQELFSRIKTFGYNPYGQTSLDFAMFEYFDVGTVIAEGNISLATGLPPTAGESKMLITDDGVCFYDNMLFRAHSGRVRLIRGDKGVLVESV